MVLPIAQSRSVVFYRYTLMCIDVHKNFIQYLSCYSRDVKTTERDRAMGHGSYLLRSRGNFGIIVHIRSSNMIARVYLSHLSGMCRICSCDITEIATFEVVGLQRNPNYGQTAWYLWTTSRWPASCLFQFYNIQGNVSTAAAKTWKGTQMDMISIITLTVPRGS